MIRYGAYFRNDVRTGVGDRLRPIPIQRWCCAEHGVVSFLPAFLARWTRYLSGVVGSVLKALLRNGRSALPLEITGPEPRTVLRWFRLLFSEALRRWLLQRLRGGPPQSTGAHEMIEIAERYACQHSLDSCYFFTVLQSARFASTSGL